jgi:hypothetical protein
MSAREPLNRSDRTADSTRHDPRTRADAPRADRAGAGARSTSFKREEKSADRKGVASIDDAVKSFLRASGIGAKLGPWPVYQAFLEAAGAAFARRARPVRFARGELVVEVDSAAHLAELQSFLGAELRVKTNQILGAENVRKLSFKLKR